MVLEALFHQRLAPAVEGTIECSASTAKPRRAATEKFSNDLTD